MSGCRCGCPEGFYADSQGCARFEPNINLDGGECERVDAGPGGTCNGIACAPGCYCASLKWVREDGSEITHGHVRCVCAGPCFEPRNCGPISCGVNCTCNSPGDGGCGCGV